MYINVNWSFMFYSFNSAYLEFFNCALKGQYTKTGSSFFEERVNASLIGLFVSFLAIIWIIARLISFPIKLLKVIFNFLPWMLGFENSFINHVKLANLSLIILIYQPFQLMTQLLGTVVGIINPGIAYQILQDASIPLVYLSTIEGKLKHETKPSRTYLKISKVLKRKLTKKFNNSSWPIQVAMKTLINEFSESINAGIVFPLASMGKFHLFDANPTVLKEEQKDLVPILLLNGNYSHQATFLPLLHALKHSGNRRAVYTINLPPNCRDDNVIINKINAIKEQFGRSSDVTFKIDVIGHSMGSHCIQNVLMADIKFEINRLITVGTPFKNKVVHNKVFDITAKNDLIIFEKSSLACPKAKLEVDTGHLGLLFHRESLNAMLSFLKS